MWARIGSRRRALYDIFRLKFFDLVSMVFCRRNDSDFSAEEGAFQPL